MNKRVKRALQGVLAAFAAPFGWLLIGFISGADLGHEITSNLGLYSYMLFGTIFAFSGFGWYVGIKEEHIESLAFKDALTGLYNLRHFQERLAEEVASAARYHEPLSMIMFDIDHFKRVNDTHGHPIGDVVLVEISATVNNIIRAHEVLARVGGEEFAIILPRCDTESAAEIAERVRQAVEALTVFTDKGKIQVTISCGVCTFDEHETISSFYQRADEAMYDAKEYGRNCVSVLKQ